MLLVANEFFDALPIVQFECNAGQLYERKVALNGDEPRDRARADTRTKRPKARVTAT